MPVYSYSAKVFAVEFVKVSGVSALVVFIDEADSPVAVSSTGTVSGFCSTFGGYGSSGILVAVVSKLRSPSKKRRISSILDL